MTNPTVRDLLDEYERALAYTASLTGDLTDDEILWRPSPESSSIGWHLAHQAAVAHYLVRNLTAAEPPLDAALDAVGDSATAERDRGHLPSPDVIAAYRTAVADRVRFRIGNIERGEVGAPAQLAVVAQTLMRAVINHEYQHDAWIAEVRADAHGKPLPTPPTSPLLTVIDGYTVLP